MNSPLYVILVWLLLTGAYVTKIGLIRSDLRASRIVLLFLAGIATSLPLLYLFSPGWNNRFMSSKNLIFIGSPLFIFGVPLMSLLFDLATRERTRRQSIFPFLIVRSACEIAFIFTGWAFVISALALFLHWVWI